MTYQPTINMKAGKPADVRGDFAPAMIGVGEGFGGFARVEDIAEGLGG